MDRREHRAPVPVRRLIFLWLLECREATDGWQNQVLEPTVPALLGAGFSGASLIIYLGVDSCQPLFCTSLAAARVQVHILELVWSERRRLRRAYLQG